MRSSLDARVVVPPTVAELQPFVDVGLLGAPEVHAAAWVATVADPDPYVALAVALGVWAAQRGHAHVDLGRIASVARDELRRVEARGSESGGEGADPARVDRLAWPDAGAWAERLSGSPAVRIGDTFEPVVAGADTRPLVLDGRRVALQRHWVDECIVADRLRRLAVDDPIAAAPCLDALLPVGTATEPNAQREAAEVVLRSRLALIVGGPGTGKTYSVARILAALLTERPDLRIALAAPTGKAAARLQESLAAALGHDDLVGHVADEVRDTIAALRPSTVHRLLGPLGDRRQRFLHDADAPLRHDVIVVDETSMVSLPLLARLCEAVRSDARLVLIGDPDQLESVELGAVLADLVAAAAAGPLAGRVVRLVRPRRFAAESPIALLADAIRSADVAGARALLAAPPTGLRFVSAADPVEASVLREVEAIVGPALRAARSAAEQGDADAALGALSEVRVLCAHRRGPFGVAMWNRLGEQWQRGDDAGRGSWFAGRPLLATRNDLRLGLANGDTGVVVRRGGRLVAVFDAAGGPVSIDPVQLDEVETSYAMTVHKSQGSEHPTVVFVVPPIDSPLLGRELLYTGVTRARGELVLVGTAAAVGAAITAPASRMTGLADALGS